MYISKIKVQNFKSLSGEHEINFEDLKGYWWMTGRIGSGKTTIGEAIIFGLFGSISDKNNKDLITWGQKKSLVEVWCEARNNSIYIKRENNLHGQSPLYVEVNGEPVEFTSKRDAQAQLENEYLDATRTTMELLCIISFNNFKSLSTLNTRDTKQFLDYVLGLDILTSYVDACKEEQSSLRSSSIYTKGQIDSLLSQINKMESMTFIEGDLEEVKKIVLKLNNDIKKAENKRTEKLQPLKEELRKQQTRLTEIKTLGSAKKREIDFIKKGVCPTCGAPIDQSSLELKEKERDNLLQQYQEINSEIMRINKDITSVDEKSIKYISEKKTLVKSQENRVIQLTEQSRQSKAQQEEIDNMKLEVEGLQDQAKQIDTDMSDYDELVQCLQTTIREKVMESFVPAINTKIREIGSMLRMSYVPEFDLAFKCSINGGVNGKIPTSSLSTGQLKLVDTVIILAILSSVITKVHSNVIFMDELFSNLDHQTRTDLLIILRSVLPADSSVIIVSHQDMESDLLDGYIKMSMNNNSSEIEITK